MYKIILFIAILATSTVNAQSYVCGAASYFKGRKALIDFTEYVESKDKFKLLRELNKACQNDTTIITDEYKFEKSTLWVSLPELVVRANKVTQTKKLPTRSLLKEEPRKEPEELQQSYIPFIRYKEPNWDKINKKSWKNGYFFFPHL